VKRIFVFLICFILFFDAGAQRNGLPAILNYKTTNYNGGTQNFAVLQDSRGLLYFGNTNGVLEFDGHNWRLIQVANKSEVHALAVDQQGKIYVGAQRDFGYLQPGASGKLEYISLYGFLKDKDKNFNDVWTIYISGKNVIYRSTSGIYIWNGKNLKVISLEKMNHRSFFVDNVFYLRADDFGLMKLEGDSLIPVKGGDFFKRNTIHSMTPYPGKRALIFTRDNGFYIYDGEKFDKLKTDFDE